MSSYDPIDEALNTKSDIIKADAPVKVEVSQKSDEVKKESSPFHCVILI